MVIFGKEYFLIYSRLVSNGEKCEKYVLTGVDKWFTIAKDGENGGYFIHLW